MILCYSSLYYDKKMYFRRAAENALSNVCFAYSLQLKIILLSSVDHNFDNCLSSLLATQTFQILAYEI